MTSATRCITNTSSLLITNRLSYFGQLIFARWHPMRLPLFAVATVAGIFLVNSSKLAFSQEKFPSKPIRIVVGSTAGSSPDILARLMGNKISETWKQPVVIDNRQPAVVANSLVAKSAPDGHTLLLASPAIAIRAAMFTNLPYDTLRDFAGVTEIGFSNVVVVVAPALGVKSVKELIEFASARPGKVFFASPPAGSADHLSVERFRFAAGIKAQNVSFKGTSESLIEIAAGRAHFGAAGLTAALPLIKDGKLLPVLQRAPGLPGVPLAADALPEWKHVGSLSILAPANTPMAIRQQVSKEVARILGLAEIREHLASIAFHVTPSSPEAHSQNLRADIAAFAKVAKDIGLKPN